MITQPNLRDMAAFFLKDIFNFTETFAQHYFNRRLMFFLKKRCHIRTVHKIYANLYLWQYKNLFKKKTTQCHYIKDINAGLFSEGK